MLRKESEADDYGRSRILTEKTLLEFLDSDVEANLQLGKASSTAMQELPRKFLLSLVNDLRPIAVCPETPHRTNSQKTI